MSFPPPYTSIATQNLLEHPGFKQAVTQIIRNDETIRDTIRSSLPSLINLQLQQLVPVFVNKAMYDQFPNFLYDNYSIKEMMDKHKKEIEIQFSRLYKSKETELIEGIHRQVRLIVDDPNYHTVNAAFLTSLENKSMNRLTELEKQLRSIQLSFTIASGLVIGSGIWFVATNMK